MTRFETNKFVFFKCPSIKDSNVLHYPITLPLQLPPLKMPIHLDISPLAPHFGITYWFLHLPLKVNYLLVAPRYLKWNLTLSRWSTISHFGQHCFYLCWFSKFVPQANCFVLHLFKSKKYHLFWNFSFL